MKIVVVANEDLKAELGNCSTEAVWIHDLNEISSHPNADAYMDLLFDATDERIAILKTVLPKPVFINSVDCTVAELKQPFIRFCGWPSFLKGQLIEAFAPSECKDIAEKIFQCFGKEMEWVQDQPGFLTPRVVSQVINEAYFALEEGVSTQAEMDTAMKLGTNYPYGPFEWAQKIGLSRIFHLLQKLSLEEDRYRPSELLKKTSQV